MTEQEIAQQLAAQSQKIDEIYKSVEKTRKYIFWAFVITVVAIIVPIIGLAFALPSFFSYYSTLGGL